jgi:hypothetical protein
MPARYDKYNPQVGNFRAALNADTPKMTGNPIAVGLNASGNVVAGASNTGIVGIMMVVKDMKAGDIVDVMTHGEIVALTGLTAGTAITANTTTGVLGTGAASATQMAVGHTVEATRLVVNMAPLGYFGT